MSTPQPVEIVRPEQDGPSKIANFLIPFVNLALRAWIVMLLAPQFWHPIGYWQSVAACLFVNQLIGNTSAPTYLRWTKGRK